MRLLAAAACAAVLTCTACGSATPSADNPTPSPTVAPTESPAPTSTPTSVPTLIPTVNPTPTRTAESSPQPTATPEPVGLLFADADLNPTSGWNELGVHNAAFAFDAGRLASTYEKKGAWAYAVRELASPESVVRIIGDFSASGEGYFGWLCGDSTTGRYYGAVPETDGSLVFIDGGRDGVEPLERYEDLGAPIASGANTTFGLQCTVKDGALWLEAFLGDGEPLALHEVEDVGDVSRFDVVGMYGESLDPVFTTSVGRIRGFGSGGTTDSSSIAAAQLLAGLPAALNANCVESPGRVDAVAGVSCYLQEEGVGPELLSATSYVDAASLRSAFSAADPASTCPLTRVGPTWSGGAVRCDEQTVGARVDWTDEASLTMGELLDFDGDTAAAYAAWLAATAAE